MKTRVITFLAFLVIGFGMYGFIWTNQEPSEEDLTPCIVKHKSEWGTQCMHCGELKGYKVSFDETYKVHLGNTCDQKLDVKICVQEQDKTWRCFHFESMSKKDTMTAWACKGTGKYLKWAKKAGDKELVFPTDAEVHELFKE